jgi:hypothetical protein
VNRAHFQQKPLRKSANLGKIRWASLFYAWSRSFMPTLQEILERNVREAAPELFEKLDRNLVRCYSCGHCCPIADGQVGVCKVRFNRGETLYVPWGYVGSSFAVTRHPARSVESIECAGQVSISLCGERWNQASRRL